MSTLPKEALAACAEARAAFEPSQARLLALQHKIVAAARAGALAPEQVDVAPAQLKAAWHGARWLYVLGGLSVLMGVWLGVQQLPAKPKVESAAHGELRTPHVSALPIVRPVVVEPMPPRAESAAPIMQPTEPRVAAPSPTREPTRARVQPRALRVNEPAPRELPDPSLQALPDIVASVAAVRETTSQDGGSAQTFERRAAAAERAAPQVNAQSRLTQELALLGEARTALRRGAFRESLSLLARHEAQFPTGQLLAERLALQARVHCELHDGARARAAFRELSVLRASNLESAVQRACGKLLTP